MPSPSPSHCHHDLGSRLVPWYVGFPCHYLRTFLTFALRAAYTGTWGRGVPFAITISFPSPCHCDRGTRRPGTLVRGVPLPVPSYIHSLMTTTSVTRYTWGRGVPFTITISFPSPCHYDHRSRLPGTLVRGVPLPLPSYFPCSSGNVAISLAQCSEWCHFGCCFDEWRSLSTRQAVDTAAEPVWGRCHTRFSCSALARGDTRAIAMPVA